MTHRTRLTTILAALALTAASHGLASSPNPNLGPNITRTYTTAELASAYGILQIGKDELWMLNFPDTVTDVLTTREGVLDTKMMGNTVALAAILPSGSLPVAIKLANGLTQYFLVTLSASHGGGIKNIVVRDASAEVLPPPASTTVTSQATSASGGARYSVQPAARPAQAAVSPANRQQLAETPATRTPAPPPSRPTPASQPVRTPYAPPQPAVSALPGGSNSPTGYPQQQQAQVPVSAGWATQAPPASSAAQMPLQAQFALQLDGTTLVLYYRLNNPGLSPYALNDAQIRVSSGGQLIPVSGRGPLSLAGGASTYGTVTLPAGNLQVSSGLAVEWSAQDQETGMVTVLRSFVNVQQASMPNWKRIALAGVSSRSLLARLR